jgi:hypothetical protein
MQEQEAEEKEERREMERELVSEFNVPIREVEEAMREDDDQQSAGKKKNPRSRPPRSPPTPAAPAPPIDPTKPYDPEAEANMQQWRLEYESDVRTPRDQRGAYIRERVVTTKDRKAREKNVRDRRRRAERGENPGGRRQDDEEEDDYEDH